jgi:hypothetical protein
MPKSAFAAASCAYVVDRDSTAKHNFHLNGIEGEADSNADDDEEDITRGMGANADVDAGLFLFFNLFIMPVVHASTNTLLYKNLFYLFR